MGPIERELRSGRPERHWVFGVHCSIAGFCALKAAAERLGLSNINTAWAARALPDVFSDAIEAAEALGL